MMARYGDAAASLSTLDIEGRVLGPDGEVRWVRSISRPHWRDDGALIWDGVLIDVTEQHLRESERERAAAMLRMGMEVAGIGTWELDPEELRLIGSEVTNALFGLPSDAGPLPIEGYLERVHPEDAAQVRRNITDAIGSRTGVRNEYRLRPPDGTVRWIASRGALAQLADGVERMIGALAEVTERRRREDEREAALAQQQVLLRELNHRIKNNLQMITSVLRLQAGRVRDPEAAQLFGRSVERVQAISDLHAQLGVGGDLGPIDFGAHLRAFCAKVRKSLPDETRIELVCETERCPLPLHVAVPLGLIANELVANALKHASPEGAAGKIRIGLWRYDDGTVRLSVSDTGRGIAPVAGGDGLGMRLVEGLARQVGARLEMQCEAGAAVYLTLPGR